MNNKIITELPNKNNRINWSEIKNKIITIIYEEKEYNIFIHRFNKSKRRLIISFYKKNNTYENWELYEIYPTNLLNLQLKNFMSKKLFQYIKNEQDKYFIDYEKNKQILGLTKDDIKKISYGSKKKIYIGCNKCKQSYLREICDILTNGCAICDNLLVIEGYNDIATTHPHLVKYFVNKNDTKQCTYGCNYKKKLYCPNCGEEKLMTPNNLNSKGFSCGKCSDGLSYPFKFVYNLMKELKVDFATEYSPDWCKYTINNKVKQGRYDFYFEHNNGKFIIETDGGQHKKERSTNSNWISLGEQKYIDEIKDELAIKHGIDIIRVDCEFSDKNYIMQNILKSKLNSLFDLIEVNWDIIAQNACNSLLIECCRLYNNGIIQTNELSCIFNVTRTTIGNWLNKGSKLNLCNYNGRSNQQLITGKKVINLDTKEIFPSLSEASKSCNGHPSNISRVCYNERDTAYGYKWSFI